MCRMSLLFAKEGYSLTEHSIKAQLNHVKQMALGNNTIPFRYGHFTDSDEYDLNKKLIHGDNFGYYLHNSTKEIVQRYSGAVFSLDEKSITKNIPQSVDISFMHARLATLGSKDISNAQPFNLEFIVGSHNGSVSGLEQGSKSDSKCIMEIINQYFSKNSSEVDVYGLEKTFIEHIVHPCNDYSAMNLIIYVKPLDKVIVLCSYNENKVKSIQHEQYYTMTIASNDSSVYISSENDFGDVTGNNSRKISTKNHTLYVIDKKTGEIEEYYLSNLEKAVDEKNKESKSRVLESVEKVVMHNTFYIIDGETGKRTEYRLSDLDETEDEQEASDFKEQSFDEAA